MNVNLCFLVREILSSIRFSETFAQPPRKKYYCFISYFQTVFDYTAQKTIDTFCIMNQRTHSHTQIKLKSSLRETMLTLAMPDTLFSIFLKF